MESPLSEEMMGLDASAAADPEPAAALAQPRSRPEPVGDAPEQVPPEHVNLLERFFVRRLQRGDARAFRELVNRHQDRVFSLALRMLGDAQEAEDISQEVFIAAHRHLPRFRGDCRLSTWLYRITRNHCLNRLKYLGRRETESATEVDSQGVAGETELLVPPERPDRALLGAEERAHVQSALRTLSPEHRLLVILRDIEGMSYEEIGRIAELPEGTIKSRLHRARAALADALAAAGMTPDGVGRARGAESMEAIMHAQGSSTAHLGERLFALIDHDLSPEDEASARSHLDECEDCAAEHQKISNAVEALGGIGRARAPSGFAARVMKRVRAERRANGLRVLSEQKVPYEGVIILILAAAAAAVLYALFSQGGWATVSHHLTSSGSH